MGLIRVILIVDLIIPNQCICLDQFKHIEQHSKNTNNTETQRILNIDRKRNNFTYYQKNHGYRLPNMLESIPVEL